MGEVLGQRSGRMMVQVIQDLCPEVCHRVWALRDGCRYYALSGSSVKVRWSVSIAMIFGFGFIFARLTTSPISGQATASRQTKASTFALVSINCFAVSKATVGSP